MVRRVLFVSACVLVAALLTAVPAAAGTVLTCADFKTRLDQTIEAMGARVTPPGVLTPLYDSGEAGKRYAWEGIVGLTGTMNCSRADAFEDFSVSIAESFRTSDDLPAVLRRFMELASASICTLAEATPNACRALTKSMTDGSLAQFKEGLAKGEMMPTGNRDFFIVNGVDAELDMTPVGISWSIGPGQAMTTDAVRQTLAPVNADK
jgi:hypothetical protein